MTFFPNYLTAKQTNQIEETQAESVWNDRGIVVLAGMAAGAAVGIQGFLMKNS